MTRDRTRPAATAAAHALAIAGGAAVIRVHDSGDGFDPRQVTMPRMQADQQLSPSDMQDAWGTLLGYRPEAGSYSVLSAGPDREFETADDLEQKVSLE